MLSLEERLSIPLVPYRGEGDSERHQLVKAHVERYFGRPRARDVSSKEWVWPLKGARDAYPGFRVLEVPPNERTAMWTYCSIGGFAHPHASGAPHEFFILLQQPAETRCTELLTMSCGYDALEGLDVGHTLPLGEPWLPGSTCTSALVSLPYPFGPELEMCQLGEEHAQILWMLPITEDERRFRHEHDLEALESKFESSGLEYWDLRRRSVV